MGERRLGLRARIAALGDGAPLLPLVLLFGLNAVDELDRSAFGLLLPEIQDHFHLSLKGVTALAAAVLPASLIVAVPVARLADRWRRVPIALTGASMWGVFAFLTGLAPTVFLLGASRVGAGLGRAVNDPVHGSLLSDYYPPTTRAKVFGVHRSANIVGVFCGPLIAGFVAQAVGWRWPFIFFSIPTFILLLFAAKNLREPARTGHALMPEAGTFREAFRTLWGVQTLRRIWLAFPFLAFVAIGLGQLFALYYRRVFDVAPGARGLIQAFDAPFIVVGLLIGTPIIDRGLKKDAGQVMRWIGLAATGIAVFIFGAAIAPSLWMGVLCSYAINIMATTLYAGGFAIISLVAPPEARASAFAFFNISSLLGITGLLFVGIVGDAFGIRTGIGLLAPVLLIGGAIVASSGRFVNADIERVNPTHDRPEEPMIHPEGLEP